MTSEGILAVLKFSGPVVGLASALWSTTQKITYETADGVKRLTLQGRVLIGITVAAALISILSLGLETIIRQQQAQQAADEKAEEDRAKAARRAERDAQIAAQLQIDALRELRVEAAEQERFLKQRFLIIGAAAAQQRRDAQISMQIAREANQRLSEAERTLAEFERINYPLRSIAAEVALALNFQSAELTDFWRRLPSVQGLYWEQKVHGGPDVLATLEPHHLGFYKPLSDELRGMKIELAFVPPGAEFPAPAEAASGALIPFEAPATVRGLTGVTLTVKRVEVDLEAQRLTAFFGGESKLSVEGVVGSGEKLSLSDVNGLVPVLTFTRRREGMRRNPAPYRLVSVAFSLNDLERFRASSPVSLARTSAFILAARPPRQ